VDLQYFRSNDRSTASRYLVRCSAIICVSKGNRRPHDQLTGSSVNINELFRETDVTGGRRELRRSIPEGSYWVAPCDPVLKPRKRVILVDQREIINQTLVRAWVELQRCADMARTGKNRKPVPKLRIYGNRLLLEEVNRVNAAGTGLPLKKLQKTGNETMVKLCYTRRSSRAELEWVYKL